VLRIRAILGSAFLLSRERVEQVKKLFEQAFPDLAGYAKRIPQLLQDPVRQG